MSGVVSAAVTYKLNTSRDERRFRHQRLEDVFVAFKTHTRQLGMMWVPYFSVMTGKLNYNQALDEVIAVGKEIKEKRGVERNQLSGAPEQLQRAVQQPLGGYPAMKFGDPP